MARKTEEITGRLAKMPTAILADALEALSLPDAAMSHPIRCLAGERFAGRARTLQKVPLPTNAGHAEIAPQTGNLLYELIDDCRDGEVLVLAVGGELRSANFGGNMAERAAILGVAAVVTDGALRDIGDFRNLGLTAFAAASSPMSSRGKFATIAADVPVQCGGVRVCPGDYIAGDADGVIVIGPAHIEAVLDACDRFLGKDAAIRNELASGETLVTAMRRHPKR